MKQIILFCIILFGIFPIDFVHATTKTAISSGSWGAAARWSPSGVPTATDSVIIPTGINITINTGNRLCKQLLLNGSLTFSGTKLTITTIYVNGTFTAAGNTLLITDIYNTGTTNVTTTIAPIPNVIINTGTLIWKAINLPIELTYFKASQLNNQIIISWQTASETNNNYFTLEHSTNNIQYKPITIVNGAGTTNITINYNYTDQNPYPDNNYYKLSQTDNDGETSVIQIIYCNLPQQSTTPLIFNLQGQQITNTSKPNIYILKYKTYSQIKYISN